MRFLQGLFASRPPGDLRWTGDARTEIAILNELPVRAENVHQRPIITVTRSPLQWTQLGFDDMTSFDFANGRKVKAALLSGTVVLNCCARVPLESESLAFFVARHLWLLRDLLMQAGNFYDVGRGLQIGAPSPAGAIIPSDQADEWYATTVVSPFYAKELSSLQPLNQQVLRSIQVRMTPYLAPVPEGQAVTGFHEPSVKQVAYTSDGDRYRVPLRNDPTAVQEVRVLRRMRDVHGRWVPLPSSSQTTPGVPTWPSPLTVKV